MYRLPVPHVVRDCTCVYNSPSCSGSCLPWQWVDFRFMLRAGRAKMISVSWLYICDLRLLRVSTGLSVGSRLISGKVSESATKEKQNQGFGLFMAESTPPPPPPPDHCYPPGSSFNEMKWPRGLMQFAANGSGTNCENEALILTRLCYHGKNAWLHPWKNARLLMHKRCNFLPDASGRTMQTRHYPLSSPPKRKQIGQALQMFWKSRSSLRSSKWACAYNYAMHKSIVMPSLNIAWDIGS